MANEASVAHQNNLVGPILRQGELAKAVAEAAVIDNPKKHVRVDDKVAYIRVQTDDEMIIRRATVEEMLGRPFEMRDLEIDLSSFAGRIETHGDYVRFWFEKHL